jgi:hypothetical protein
MFELIPGVFAAEITEFPNHYITSTGHVFQMVEGKSVLIEDVTNSRKINTKFIPFNRNGHVQLVELATLLRSIPERMDDGHLWKMIPGFFKYEMKSDGVVRNRITRRIISKLDVHGGSLHYDIINNNNEKKHLGLKKTLKQLFPPPIEKVPEIKIEDGIEWRLLKNFPDYYISMNGLIYNHITKRNILTQVEEQSYITVQLKSAMGKRKGLLVHVLVANTFTDKMNPRSEDQTQVDHKDFDKNNCSISNLEFVTPEENIRRSIIYHQEHRKIEQIDIATNRVIKVWQNAKQAAESLQRSLSSIYRCCTGESSSAHNFKWRLVTETIKEKSTYTGEVWKFVKHSRLDSVDKYEVSNFGRIKRREKMLKPKIHNGYRRVTLYNRKSKKVEFGVHILVALAFLPKPTAGRSKVDHKDENKSNNKVSNLLWATNSENITRSCGKKVNQIENDKIINTFDSLTNAAKHVHCTRCSIGAAIKHNTKCKGFNWKLAD